MKVRLISFILCILFWIVDMMTTIIGLNFIPGMYETNDIARYLFNTFGVWGYVFDIIMVFSIVWFSIYFIVHILCQKIFNLLSDIEMSEQIYVVLYVFFVLTFCIGEFLAILNNLGYILAYF